MKYNVNTDAAPWVDYKNKRHTFRIQRKSGRTLGPLHLCALLPQDSYIEIYSGRRTATVAARRSIRFANLMERSPAALGTAASPAPSSGPASVAGTNTALCQTPVRPGGPHHQCLRKKENNKKTKI